MKRITVLCGKYSGNSSDDWQSSDECTTEATSTHGFTLGEQRSNRPRPVTTNIRCKLDNHYYKGNAGNHPGKNFTGILPKSRFFGRKWLNNMLGGANMGMAELNSVIAQQERNAIPLTPSKEDYACICGYDRQLVGYVSPNVQSEGGNQSGKNFTGILPKSRFFGQKWLNILLGGANPIMADFKEGVTGYIEASATCLYGCNKHLLTIIIIIFKPMHYCNMKQHSKIRILKQSKSPKFTGIS